MKKIDNSTATGSNLFTDGDPEVPTPATTLPAWYMNMLQIELVKVVEMAGITLDPTEDDYDPANVNQIAEAFAVHVAGLDFYEDTGAADAYVLSVIGADEAENTEPTYFDGMRVRFLPSADNTGAATIRVGSQAIKNIKVGPGAGEDPGASLVRVGYMSEFYYDETNDVFKPSFPFQPMREVPQVSKSSAYTCVLSDGGKHIFHPSADTTARTWTIPANSSVPFKIGTAITFVNQDSAGDITISITTDTMRLAGAGTTGNRTLAANGIATALKVTATEWIISGTGLT